MQSRRQFRHRLHHAIREFSADELESILTSNSSVPLEGSHALLWAVRCLNSRDDVDEEKALKTLRTLLKYGERVYPDDACVGPRVPLSVLKLFVEHEQWDVNVLSRLLTSLVKCNTDATSVEVTRSKLEYLIQRGASWMPPEGDKSAAFCAVISPADFWFDALMPNFERGSLDVNSPVNQFRYTVLHALLQADLPVETMKQRLKRLLEEGADPNARDREGRTALHIAVAFGRQKTVVVPELIAGGASLALREEYGGTPFEYGAAKGAAVDVLEMVFPPDFKASCYPTAWRAIISVCNNMDYADAPMWLLKTLLHPSMNALIPQGYISDCHWTVIAMRFLLHSRIILPGDLKRWIIARRSQLFPSFPEVSDCLIDVTPAEFSSLFEASSRRNKPDIVAVLQHIKQSRPNDIIAYKSHVFKLEQAAVRSIRNWLFTKFPARHFKEMNRYLREKCGNLLPRKWIEKILGVWADNCED